MELLLLEPQLESPAGHYNRYVRVFAGEAARRGFRLSVASSRTIKPRFKATLEELGVRVLPAFEQMPYRMKVNATQRDIFSRWIADQALASLRQCPGAHPVWLSGTAALLGGACLFAEELREPFLFQMLDCALDWPMGRHTAPQPLREAVERAMGSGLRLYAQSAFIADHLSNEVGAPVGVFPAILDLQPLKDRPLRARPVVGMINMMRASKEFAPALSELMAHGDSISLLLHTGAGTTIEAIHTLKERIDGLAQHYRLKRHEVRIVAGVLPAAEYVEMWQGLDCTILPYNPARYLRQGSGVLFESLADAIIPIAPLGTSMAATMLEHGVGLTYDIEKQGSLHDAISMMLENFETMSQRLRAFAPVYREANSPTKVVDTVLNVGIR